MTGREEKEFEEDFATDDLRWHATERHAYATYNPRVVMATCPPPPNPYDWLARMLRRRSTPYHPCSDLPKGPWDV